MVNVNGNSGPWSYSTTPGGLNHSFQYGLGDQAAPTIVSSENGFSFAAGGTITLEYLSGLVNAGPEHPNVDANGEVGTPINNGNPGGFGITPSFYMNPATYPIYLVELVGTFATSTGAIVGTPFAIGDGPISFTIPAGANQLQLGVNDNRYSDNTGSFIVQVAGPAAVPEPSTLLTDGIGASLFLAYGACRRFQSAASSKGYYR